MSTEPTAAPCQVLSFSMIKTESRLLSFSMSVYIANCATNPGSQDARGSNNDILVDLGGHNMNPTIIGSTIDLC